MHGQVKTDKSAAVKEKEKKQKDAKLKVYREGMAQIFERRKANVKDWETMRCVSDVLCTNPDIYTLWNIRKEILLSMIEENSIEDPIKVGECELKLTETCLRLNPKSYGAWHHRCWILEHFPQLNLKLELALCNKYLKLDSRNFHCWDYRRFVTSKLGLSPEDELSYTMQKIEEDFSNYSSWHYRSKLLPLIHSDPAGVRPIKEEIHLQELDLVQNAAFTDPNDQSAWYYLRWLLGRLEPKLEIVLAFISEGTGKMYVGFNREASPADSSVKIANSKWATVSSLKYCSLWIADAPSNPSEEYVLNVTLRDENENLVLRKRDDFRWYKDPQFDPDVSPKLKAVLKDQLESCNQLLDLEPESKWPLLTSVVFMKSIDPTEFKEEILKRLRSLMEFDSFRRSYYADMMSKFLLEESFKSKPLSDESPLADLGLTTLYHTQYLSGRKQLDLSRNRLQRSLPKLLYAVNCEILNLDDNDLSSLESLPLLPKVTAVSLACNQLEDPAQILLCLDKLPSLQKLNLTKNPVTTDVSSLKFLLNEIKMCRKSVNVIVD